MADVAVVIRVMPESDEVNLDNLEKMVRERVAVHSVSREPIAFGLEALHVTALIQDAAGGTDPLEQKLASIPGVGNVQVISLTRVF
ncbi:MAG: elongation factor 1-beta [Candidatus Hadarchaeota archaeon]